MMYLPRRGDEGEERGADVVRRRLRYEMMRVGATFEDVRWIELKFSSDGVGSGEEGERARCVRAIFGSRAVEQEKDGRFRSANLSTIVPSGRV